MPDSGCSDAVALSLSSQYQHMHSTLCAQLWLSRTVYVDAGVNFDEVAVLEGLRRVRRQRAVVAHHFVHRDAPTEEEENGSNREWARSVITSTNGSKKMLGR